MKLLIIDYVATGEGRTLYIKSGDSKKELLLDIPEFFKIDYDIFEISKIKKILNNEYNNEESNYIKKLLNNFIPFYCELLKNGFEPIINFEIHYNLT